MAERIKGITIEFDGDASGLKKAITTINNEAKKTNRALTDVNKALKLKPNSVTLLTQKQQLLRRRTEEVTDKVQILKMRLDQMGKDPSVNKKSAEYQKLKRQLISAQAYQKQFAREMLKFGNAKFTAVGNSLQSVGKKLTGMTRRARQAAGALAGIALYKGFQRLKTLDDVSTELQKLGYQGDKLTQIMDDATNSVSGTKYQLTDMAKVAKGALGAGVEEAYDLGDYLQRVADLAAVGGTKVSDMGALMNKALSKGRVDAKLLNQMNANGIPIYNLLAKSMGVTKQELDKMVRSGEVGFDDLYKATEKYKGMAQSLGTETLSGAATVLGQQFGLMGADFLEGAYEPIKTGVQGIVAYLKELRANGTIKEWGNAVGEAIKYFVTWFKEGEASTEGMSGKAQGLVTAFGPVIKIIGTLVKAFIEMPSALKTVLILFGLFGGPLLTLIGGFVKFLGVISQFRMLFQIFGSLKVALTALLGFNPIFLAIAAGIAAVVAAGVLLYKNWDTIKAKASALYDSVKAAFSKVKTAITQPFTNAWNTLKNILGKIKGLFPLKIGKIFSNLKLPHISVSGGKAPFGIAGKGKLPHFSVKWYAQGGIFNNPSVIGVGERGPEAVIPLSGSRMAPFAEEIAANMGGGGIDYDRLAAAIVGALASVNTDINLYIGGKQAAVAMAPFMNVAINQIQERQDRQLGFV